MFSIIIPYYGNNLQRQEALGMLLRTLSMQDFQGEKEVILVYQGTEDQFKTMQPLLLSVVDQFIFLGRGDEPFNKSWCINIAVNQSSGDSFTVVDVDMIFGLDYIRFLAYYSTQHLFCIGWSNLIFSPGKDQTYYRHVTPQVIETAGGVFSFNKNFFVNDLGMMNENYEGYGGEDNDIYYRAKEILTERKLSVFYMPYALLHYYHDWNRPNISNVTLMEKTKQNIHVVISRLKEANLGSDDGSTKINMDDLGYVQL